jgi:hypothetical protein
MTYTMPEVAEILGVDRTTIVRVVVDTTVLYTSRKMNVGKMKAGCWWFTEEELGVLKDNSRRYLLAHRDEV